jgi:hypothetical protein
MAFPSDYKAPRATIQFPGHDTFTVRGLNFQDLAAVMEVWRPDIGTLVMLYRQAQTDVFSTGSAETLVIEALQKVPDFVAEMLSMVIDDGQVPASVILQAPIGVQIEAVTACLRLTLEDFGGPKSLAEITQTVVGLQSAIVGGLGHAKTLGNPPKS